METNVEGKKEIVHETVECNSAKELLLLIRQY
jgi:hypothetical protein